MTISRICAIVVFAVLCASAAHGFDHSLYQAADLDEIAAQPRPKTGADILSPTRIRITGALIAYGEPCQAGFMKKAMLMGGITQADIDNVPVTSCIKLRTAKGKDVRLFIQDVVAGFLPKEVPLGGAVTLYALRLFNDTNGPGLLVNEFTAGNDNAAGMPPKKSVQVDQSPKGPATNSAAATSELRGEWHRAGQSFACRVTTQGKLPPEAVNPVTLTNACLYMGPFGIGRDASTVAAVLGPPHRTLPQPNEAIAHFYFLEAADRLPYLIATIRKDKIIALQVSGAATSKDFTFNHIKLGDDTAALVKYFGAAKQVTPSSIKDTDVWSYGPWPFSFEVKGGRVTSVRIVDSTHEQ